MYLPFTECTLNYVAKIWSVIISSQFVGQYEVNSTSLLGTFCKFMQYTICAAHVMKS